MWKTNQEDFENMPKRESRKYYLTKLLGDLYNSDKFDHPWYRSHNKDITSIRIDKVVKKFIGKSFDDAFSYFCKLPKITLVDQDAFIKEFYLERYGRYIFFNKYCLDECKNIILNPNYFKIKKNKEIKVKTFDFKLGWIHPRYGMIYKDFTSSILNIDFDKLDCYIVRGCEKTFKSRKDPEYKKFMHENKSKKKAYYRNHPIIINYSF